MRGLVVIILVLLAWVPCGIDAFARSIVAATPASLVGNLQQQQPLSVHWQHASVGPQGGRSRAVRLSMSTGAELDDATRAFLDKVVKSNKVVLFMKGNALFPQCGFSNTACRILDAIGTKFETVNVLDSDQIRNGVKIYSSWPTIPQLYVGGEFVGGSDIMIELYNNGQLAEMIELANAN